MVMYTIENCRNCEVLGRMLDRKGLEFKEESARDKAEEFKARGIMSVPVLQVGDQFLSFGEAITWINSRKFTPLTLQSAILKA